ncbi:MAG TPA: amino acid adenylation domain-containing protein [Thermoanaerobaculia bacterium]|jgi:amino acid adenylation domain-containing protein|nr:amino acid adenylation domain-containing protein [Thermoanaerobaculia bacterium]
MESDQGTPSTLVELLRRRASLQPERVGYSFLRDGDGAETNATYAELDRRARGLGAALQRMGARDERALLLYPPGIDYVAAFFGCLYGGTAAVPAYPPRPNRPSPRIRSIIENAAPRVILTTAALRPKLESILQVPGGTEWLVTDDPLQPVAGAADLAALADDWSDPGVEPSALAFLQYTSGSTAAPKGVRLSHANLLHNLELIRTCFAQTERERTVIWLPPYHDMGLIGGILEPLYAGYPVTLLSPVAFLQQPVRWLRAISSTRATTSGGPNFAYDLCVRKISEEQKQDLDLSSWTLAFNGAEPIRPDTLDRFTAAFGPCGFRREAFYPCYGLAEATLLVAAGRRFSGPVVRSFAAGDLETHQARLVTDATDARTLVGCGLAADPQAAYPAIVIVRPDSSEPCAPGEVGEIWVHGPSVAQGYWRQPEESERVFNARLTDGSGPFLRTGDLGFVTSGELFVTGRLKDLIILRGRNHYPQDVEITVERSHPALRPGCSAAFAVERDGEERLAVVAEVHREHRQDDAAEIAGIVAAIRRAVADEHEVAPDAVVLLRPATLPKTSSGKIQRHACRAGFLAGTLAAVATWKASDEAAAVGEAAAEVDLAEEIEPDDLVRWLAGEVARRSGAAPAGVDPRQSIASFALDSLATIELMHAIEQRVGASVDMETLFSEVSLADLAASLRQQRTEPAATVPATVEVGDFPLSRAQLSLWFLHALAPESPAYNVPNAVRVRGDLDAPALLGALQTLVDRHPVLRTTFVAVAGEPLQRVAAVGELEIGTHDASTWGEDQLAAHLDAESQRPFDLERGPLARVVFYSRSPIDHVLLLTMHHIVTDFWSLGVLLDELAELYGAHCAGRAAQLPPVPPTYADWTLWQERELAGPAGSAHWAYWHEHLAGELPVLELHTDRPRPLVQGTAGRAHKKHLAEPLTAEVRRLARNAGTTPFVILLAAFEALLHRYSGQAEMLLGTVSAARTRAAFAHTAGYFVNPLVLRADLRGDPGFGLLVALARRDAQGAFTHQDYPFPLLVEKLQPQRDAGRSPLFQVMFVMQKAMLADGQDLTGFALGEPGSRVELGGLAMETIPLPQRIAQFDLTLTVGEVNGRLVASFDSNVDLFDAATIQRLAGHFEHLLNQALADPNRAVSELPLLDAGERRQLIEVWNDTTAQYSDKARDQATLADLFARQAAATPAATAAIFAGHELTYAELARRAGQLAGVLRRLGIGPEERVGICVERSFDVLVAALGVLGAGGAYLPIDPEYPRERIAHLVATAGAGLILTQRPLLPLVEPRDQSADGPLILCLDDDLQEQFPPLPAGGRAMPVPANLACTIFTSGSTGLPKGVLLDHANLVNLVDSFAHSYRPTADDRILPLTSIAYASFVGEVFPLLCTGGTVVLPQKHELLDVAALVSLIARHKVTMVSTVPSMLASLDALGDRLPRLRLLLIGGEALTTSDVAGLLARSGELRIVNGYGLTETAICSTIYDVEPADLAAGRQPPIGKPLPNQRTYVLDRHLEPRPIGCAGELYVAGTGVARGYAGRPDLTAARFLPDPFATGGRMYRTGDLAAVRADGNLVYLGRGDQQVKLRGFRIELAEIESVLAHLPGVKTAAVLVRQDDGEPRLVGYVVPWEGATAVPSVAELLRGLRERLPDYMVPAALVFLDELPRTVNGKLDTARLPAPAHTRPELAAAYSAPRSELERSIAAVWSAALKLESVGLDDNFFDLGGHSLLMAKVHARLGEALGREVSLIELFQYPTVGSLARHLARAAETTENEAGGSAPPARRPRRQDTGIETDIAVIGLSGRFPGAADVPRLWLNLVAGREGIRFFSAEELINAGVDPELVARPDYVKAKGILGNVDQFDAAFFGLNPREVELMDPQHRIFLECAWEALEDAGWEADRYPGLIGVYAGLSMNTYLLMNLVSHMALVASADTLQASLGNDKDPLTARVSYKLNLKGPSITIQSASSTSLVAVHTACQALINRDCDMALTGGVSIHLPEASGYLYQEGGTVSRDGHCRAFDAASTGFVSGHGCGVVVLKRLSEALADKDHVYAVIKGSACNNDGSHKVSFMAPSVDGQIQLYNLAYENAGIDPATVSYVECHGTGTLIGDPIEIGALSQAFAARTERKGFCAIGSLKTNIGHLDTAAGVCGLIKAVLCLHHRTLPPTLHFSTPNPRIDFANSPFFVNTELRPWETADGGPRRAGVTSLGMGGTNAHVVLEEAPRAATPPTRSERPQLLVLSAKSANALDSATFRLAEHLRDEPDLPLADVAFTLQVGRKAFQHRRALLCRDLQEAALALETLDAERVLTFTATPGEHPVAFLFPGQGAQYPGMGRGLYESEPAFRDAVDRCCELLPFDLRAAMWSPMPDGAEAAAERLQQTEVAQPALFVLSWATAQLWLSWGVRPSALLGHSIGEYVAGCLAGVFSLEDALALVMERGRLMQRMAPGAMLAVPLPEAEVAKLLEHFASEISLAAVNRPDLCVVSGDPAALDALTAALAAEGVATRRLHTSHAFHSHTADPILEPFTAAVRRMRLSPPAIPLVSNVTGTWMRPEDATDPAYWARQLRGTVRFADGLAQLLAEPQRILLEVGPGDTLSSFARQHPAHLPEQAVIPSLRHPKSAVDDAAVLQRAVARLWLSGGDFDWEAFGAAEERHRVSLPTYPFERRRFWVDPLPERERAGRRQPDPRDWTYAPVWKPQPLPEPMSERAGTGAAELWLLLLDPASGEADLGTLLASRLAADGHWVVSAFAGEHFARIDGATFTVAPGSAADFQELLAFLPEAPAHIVHLWALPEPTDPRAAFDRGFYSLLFLAQALGQRDLAEPASLLMVTPGLHAVTGDEPTAAPHAMPAYGPSGVLPRELPNVFCKALDVLPTTAETEIVEQILAESARNDEPWVALRHGQRFVRGFELVPATVPVPAPGDEGQSVEGPERTAAPSADHPRPALANPYVAPENELQQQIAAVWQEVLGVDRVGLHDNFFELGGNSLAGLRVVGRLKERLEVGVSEVSLYEAPTVAAMARLVGAERQSDPENPTAAAPTFEGSRSRGERRKAKLLQKARSDD